MKRRIFIRACQRNKQYYTNSRRKMCKQSVFKNFLKFGKWRVNIFIQDKCKFSLLLFLKIRKYLVEYSKKRQQNKLNTSRQTLKK